jgi:hypothetical protein
MTNARVHDPARGDCARCAPLVAMRPELPRPGGMVSPHAYLKPHPGPWIRGAVRARTTRFAKEGSVEPRQCRVVRTVSLKIG